MKLRTKNAIKKLLGEVEKKVDKEWQAKEIEIRYWDEVCRKASGGKYTRYMSEAEAKKAGLETYFREFKKAEDRIDIAYKIINHIEEIEYLISKFDNE